MFYSVNYPDEQSVILKANESFSDDDLRIKFLKEYFLEKIMTTGWETLRKDPKDARFWEETRFFGYMHGGGYPFLHNISEDTAKVKYNAKKN